MTNKLREMNTLEKDDIPIKIIRDKKYSNMYRLQWKNGDVSIKYWDGTPEPDGINITSYGMYNLSRANDILRNYQDYANNMALRQSNSLADARKAKQARKVA